MNDESPALTMSGGPVGLKSLRFVNLCVLPVNICGVAPLHANVRAVQGYSPSVEALLLGQRETR